MKPDFSASCFYASSPVIFLCPAYFYIQNNIFMFVCGHLQDSSTPKVNTFSVSSSWFCCIGFSFCNFMRLMTLSHTCEASLTKIQQHNVHSIFVSFFFSSIEMAFQSALSHLESLLVLATAQWWCQCWENVFAKQMEKHHCVAHTHTHILLSWWFHGLHWHSVIHYKVN